MIATYVSATQFTVSGDETAEFTAGRRIKADCGVDGIKYSTVSNSSYSSPNTTVTIDESVLTSNLTDVLYGIINSGAQGSLPNHNHTSSEGTGGQISFNNITDFSLAFTELSDTPSSYTPDKYLKTTASGLAFVDTPTGSGSGVSTFLELTDTPSSYTSTAGKYLASTGTGLEFVTAPTGSGSGASSFLELTDTPSSYSASNLVRTTASGLEFIKAGRQIYESQSDIPIGETHYQLDTNTGALIIATGGTGWSIKSFVIDAADCYTTNYAGITKVEFYLNDEVITVAEGDIAAYATSTYSNYDPKRVFISSYPKYNQTLNDIWHSSQGTNLRIYVVFATSILVDSIVVNNFHYGGSLTDRGFQNVKVYITDQTVISTVYNSAISGGELLYDGVFTQHPASDIADDQTYASTEGYSYTSVGTLKPSFLELTDTPTTYSGNVGKYLTATASGLLFVDAPTGSGSGASTFLELTDTPSSYTSTIGKYIASTGTGLEFVDAPTGSGSSSWFFGTSDPTVLNPAEALAGDLYYSSTDGGVWKRNASGYTTLFSDTFDGTTLDTEKWNTRTRDNASITVSGVLQLNNISGDLHSGAVVTNVSSFAVEGTHVLTFKWKPHKNHYATAEKPRASFVSATNTPTYSTNYGYSITNSISLGLGRNSDSTERTGLVIVENETEYEDVAIDIDENVWHDVTIQMNWDTGYMSVSMDDDTYSVSRTIGSAVLSSIGAYYRLEFSSSDYNRDNTEQFDDILLQIPPPTAWALQANFWPSFIELEDTPTTYSGNVGKYLAATASGLAFVDAPTGSGSGASTFLELTDTPSSYTSTAGQYLASTGAGLEFVTAPTGSGGGTTTFIALTDTPNSYTDNKVFVSTVSGIESAEFGKMWFDDTFNLPTSDLYPFYYHDITTGDIFSYDLTDNEGAYAYFDPANTSSNLTLTINNSVVTSNTYATDQSAISVNTFSDKVYFEMLIGTTGTYSVVGFCNTNHSKDGRTGLTADSWGLMSSGRLYHDSSYTTGPTFSEGDVVQIAVDPTAGKAWAGVNGTWYNSGDPATGTNPSWTDSTISGTLLASVSFRDVGHGGTLHSGYADFTYIVPIGYTPLSPPAYILVPTNVGTTKPSLLDLTDTPATYSGAANKFLTVSTTSGISFTTFTPGKQIFESIEDMPLNETNYYLNPTTGVIRDVTPGIGGYVAKSVIFDIADNYGDGNYVGLRQVDFYLENEHILLTVATNFLAYVTSDYSDVREPEWVFDTSTSLTGAANDNSWMCNTGQTTNQRLIIVFNAITAFDKIVVNNYHGTNTAGGGETDRGARNVSIYISDTTITDTTYGASTESFTQIFSGLFQQHTEADVADPEVVLDVYNVEAFSGTLKPSFTDLTDTPTTYSGIEGNYLRVTASGIQAIDGIILTASDLSEWVLKVTASGTLYTEAV